MRCMAVIRQGSAQSVVLVEKNYNYNVVILAQCHSITECLVVSSALTTLKTQIIQTMMVEGRQDSLPLWTAIRYESAKYGYQEIVS